jgi:hypothetical protein
MTDTGKAKATTKTTPMAGAGIRLQTDASYIGYHQNKYKTRPARPVFPKGKMPKSWEEAISSAVEQAFQKSIK